MLSPFQLLKTERLISQLQELLKGLTMKNWITTLHGVAIVVIGLSQIWLPQYKEQINATVVILIASGFFTSKDFNK
jgi:hypothetical protein